MTLRETVETINKIEQAFPVQTLTYKQLKIWPICRVSLAQMLSSPSSRITPQKRKKELYSLRDLRYRLKESHQIYQKVKASVAAANEQSWQSYATASPTDILFFCKPNERKEIVQGKYFSKFSNSLAHFAQGYHFKIIEFTDGHFLKEEKFGESVYIDDVLTRVDYEVYQQLVLLKLGLRRRSTVREWSTFTATLQQMGITYPVTEEVLVEQLERILLYKKHFVRMLKQFNPRLIFLCCFYHDYAFALTLAANECGIKVVELQHGQQGAYHFMYSHWHQYPAEGYEVIPQLFWMWSKANVARIEQWAGKSKRHRVVVGGNPWLGYQVHHPLKNEKHKQLTSSLQKYKKVVLVALQFSTIPDYLLEAMQTRTDIYWFIRLHPRFLHEKSKVVEILSDVPSQHYNIEEANKLPIYTLFKLIDVQITCWSTVAYEALAFDVPTILIHKNGYDAMKSYVDKKIFYYTENKQELLDLILQQEKYFQPEEERYIAFDKPFIQAKLASLLEEHPPKR
ncbi:MAG: hypothetical protein ACFB0B_14230 [Thermonemataceae bacterium]